MSILVFAGSLRKDSLNKKLARIVAKEIKEKNFEVELIELNNFEMPIYDGDIEEKGFPEKVMEFREKFEKAEGVFIITPEYNFSIPGGLKNIIDWLSRKKNLMDSKVIAIGGASNGRFGTIRVQTHFKEILLLLNAKIIGYPSLLIVNGNSAFDSEGNLVNENDVKAMKKLVEVFLQQIKKD
ncbi:FMN-dependent NADH-azoreductase [uncultured archaeon]|nr:FMN-dependent NADH-azoreductase [uncultured archaeon]